MLILDVCAKPGIIVNNNVLFCFVNLQFWLVTIFIIQRLGNEGQGFEHNSGGVDFNWELNSCIMSYVALDEPWRKLIGTTLRLLHLLLETTNF